LTRSRFRKSPALIRIKTFLPVRILITDCRASQDGQTKACRVNRDILIKDYRASRVGLIKVCRVNRALLHNQSIIRVIQIMGYRASRDILIKVCRLLPVIQVASRCRRELPLRAQVKVCRQRLNLRGNRSWQSTSVVRRTSRG
jgi:hypothetical protein